MLLGTLAGLFLFSIISWRYFLIYVEDFLYMWKIIGVKMFKDVCVMSVIATGL